MRRRKTDKHLPSCVYLKHGAFWYVKNGKWTRLHEKLPEALSAYARLIQGAGNNMADLIDRAHPAVIRNKAENTIKQYNQARDVLKEILKNFDYEQVKPKNVAAIKEYYNDRPNMGNRILSYLRMVFDKAVEWQLVDSNPCTGIKRHVEHKRTRYLTHTEFQAIRDQASDNIRAILDITYLTGQRIGDVLKIQMDDITADGIFFQQQKTGNRVLVQMTPDLCAAIDAATALPRDQRGTTLFCTIRGGRQYSYGTVRDMFRIYADRAGIKDARLHDLRAKALTDADAEGLNATHLGGHSDPRQTQRYIRLRKTTLATPPTMKK